MSNSTSATYTSEDVKVFQEGFDANYKSYRESNSNTINLFEEINTSAQEGLGSSRVRDIIVDNIRSAVEGFIPVGFPVPSLSTMVFVSDMGTAEYVLTVRIRSNKGTLLRNINNHIKLAINESNGEEAYGKVLEYLANNYRGIVVSTMAAINLDYVNQVYAEALSADYANKDFSVKFIPQKAAKRSTRIVDEISNEHIVLVVPETIALDKIPNIPVFQGITVLPPIEEVAQEDRRDYYLVERNNQVALAQFESIVADLEQSVSVVDFLRNHKESLKILTNFRNHKISTLISKAFTSKIQGVTSLPKKGRVVLVAEDGIIGAVEYIPPTYSLDEDGNEVEVPGVWEEYLAAVTFDGAEPTDIKVMDVANKVLEGIK